MPGDFLSRKYVVVLVCTLMFVSSIDSQSASKGSIWKILKNLFKEKHTKVCYAIEMFDDLINGLNKWNHLARTLEKFVQPKETSYLLRHRRSFDSSFQHSLEPVRLDIARKSPEKVHSNKNIDDDSSSSSFFSSMKSEHTRRRKRSLRDYFNRIRNDGLSSILKNPFRDSNIKPLVENLTSALGLLSSWKEKMNQTNFQSTFLPIIEKIDLEKLVTEQIIEKFILKMKPDEIIDQLLNSSKLNEIFLKVLHFDQSVSPMKSLLKFLQLDQLFEHVQDPQTLFKWLLPNINQSGIDHVIHDLQDTLQAVIDGVTNTKDVLTETAIKQGIPYVIQTFELQNVIPMDILERLSPEHHIQVRLK